MRSIKMLALAFLGTAGLVACPDKPPVPVKEKPMISLFTASPSSVAPEGGTVTLKWSVKDASEVSIDRGVGIVTGDSKTVEVKASTSFTLTAKNEAGTVTATAEVTLGKDTTRPTVTSSLPAGNASGVTVGTGISVTFSEAMKADSVRLEISPSLNLGDASWDAAKTTLSFDPAADLTADTGYTLTVDGDDLSGNSLVTKKLSFRTAEVPTITLTGHVVGDNGQPLANAPVVLLGNPVRTVTADSTGAFSFDKVRAPYDIAVVNGSVTPSRVLVYQGLTRRDPTVAFINEGFGQPRWADVYGYLSENGNQEPPQRDYRCAFETTQASPTCALADNSYLAYLDWQGPTTLTGALHIIGWFTQAGTRNYVYGKRDAVAVSDRTGTFGVGVDLNPVASGALSGSITASNGYQVYERSLTLNFSENASAYLFSDTGNASSFSYVTPVIDGTTLALSATAYGSGAERVTSTKRGLSTNASGVRLNLPGAPTPSLPGNGSSGVNLGTQTFSWGPMSGGGVSAVSFFADGVFRLTVVTANASLTWPRIADLSVGAIPANTRLSWQVTGLSASKVSSLDDFAAPDGLRRYRSSDVVQGESDMRSFTTN